MVTHVDGKALEVRMSAAEGGKVWNGVAYSCPQCNAVLSVQIDPVAIKTDTINGVIGKLRGH